MVTVSWTDTNTAANEVAEGAAAGTAVGITAKATLSTNGKAKFTYSLTDGADAFAIDSKTGAITVKDGSLLDYEAGSSETVTVKATVGNVTSFQTYTVDLTDVYTVRDVTHGGSFTATTEEDYFVIDFDAMESRMTFGGDLRTASISGFDPTVDKIILEHFSLLSTQTNPDQSYSLSGDNTNSNDAIVASSTFYPSTPPFIGAGVGDNAESGAAVHVYLPGVQATSGEAMLQQFGQIWSGDFVVPSV